MFVADAFVEIYTWNASICALTIPRVTQYGGYGGFPKKCLVPLNHPKLNNLSIETYGDDWGSPMTSHPMAVFFHGGLARSSDASIALPSSAGWTSLTSVSISGNFSLAAGLRWWSRIRFVASLSKREDEKAKFEVIECSFVETQSTTYYWGMFFLTYHPLREI